MVQPILERSDEGTLDLVLAPGEGSPRGAWRGVLSATFIVPLFGAVGLLLAVPAGLITRFWLHQGWATAAWVALAVVGLVALVGWVPLAVDSFRGLLRLRFSPVPAPDTVVVVRGYGPLPPLPTADVMIVVAREEEVPYEGDPRPAGVTVTLRVELPRRNVPPRTLPADTDTEALHRELSEGLGPTVRVEHRVHRTTRVPPSPPGRHVGAAYGRGGSTGGATSGGGGPAGGGGF
ncbi:hypothetical protein ACWEQL_29965 [Kitasatospora sp. NPDC004240]